MKLYNVELFDEHLNFISNTLVPQFEFKKDYLDPEINKITCLPGTRAELNNWIHIWSDDGESIVGIVSQVTEKESGGIEISFKDAVSLFDVEIMIDTEGFSGTFENYIKDRITELYISNTDTSMNIQASVEVESETAVWGLDIEPEDELTTLAKVNFFDDIIIPAFKTHGIIISADIDLGQRTIEFTIGKNERDAVTIEADLLNVIRKNITLQKISRQVNKVIVTNKDTWEESITFYLHPGGTFDTTDSNRITPVAWEYAEAGSTSVATSQQNETIPFSENAEKTAASIFARNKYDNLVEIELLSDDDLVNPQEMKVGQKVFIISEGQHIESILTGKKVKDTTTLTFGMVRVELTKILKGRS